MRPEVKNRYADKAHAPISLILNGIKVLSNKEEGYIYKGSKENVMLIIAIDVSKNKLDCALIDNLNHAKFKLKVVSNFEDGFN